MGIGTMIEDKPLSGSPSNVATGFCCRISLACMPSVFLKATVTHMIADRAVQIAKRKKLVLFDRMFLLEACAIIYQTEKV